MPEGPDLKNRVRFSDNPKMDNSGLSVTPTSEMWLGNDKKPTKVSGPEISGGQIREAAIAAGLNYGAAAIQFFLGGTDGWTEIF